MRATGAAFLTLLAVLIAGCGGSGSRDPGGAVKAYLSGIVDNDGAKACDALTVSERAKLVQDAGTTDCPALVEQYHDFLGENAKRLKSVSVSGGDRDRDATTVTASLDGRSVDVAVVKVDKEWRVDSGDVSNLWLLGSR